MYMFVVAHHLPFQTKYIKEVVMPLDCYLTDCRTVPMYDKRLGLPDCQDKISTMIR